MQGAQSFRSKRGIKMIYPSSWNCGASTNSSSFFVAHNKLVSILNPYTINPPESEVVFEKLCLTLLKRHWSRPGLERFAKRGEEQFGVDVFDTLGESPLYAAQCKLKEQWKSLEPAEIREEVGKAKTFPSRLNHYAILTTGKISGAAQLAVQSINQEHRAEGLFTVELFTWEKITELIRQYPEIEQQFYGGLRVEEVATVSSKLDYIAKLTESVTSASVSTEIDALIDEARARITPREAQIAILLLNRIQRTKGGDLSDWHRFRIFTNIGAASLILGKTADAARHFLDAKPLRPDDELAVTNEVLAYHLLYQDDETRARSTAAIERFPNSTRLRSLWIQSASSDNAYEELLDATPSHMRNDAEVASALCKKALAVGLIQRAIEHAKEAVANKPSWSQTHFLLAQAYFGRVAMAERKLMPLKREDKQTYLSNALSTADEAISAADVDGDMYVKAQALALKSDIALIQGRKEDAARFARESFGADSSQLQGITALALASLSMGHMDEAIRVLEEAYAKANSAANVSFMLGQALMARGTDHDLDRAVEVFSTANVKDLDRELIDPIVVGAIRALIRGKRFIEVRVYLTRPEVAASPVIVATTEAYLALKSSDARANKFLDAAIASRQSTGTRAATDFLARTLMEVGRLSDALPLLQELFDAQTPNFEAGLLLSCASRLKQDKVVMDICQALYERGELEWDLLEFESQYLEEYDFPKAISRLQEYIATNPAHLLAKLRLAVIGMRFGKNDLITVSEDILPAPEELPMRYAVPTIHLLLWHSQEKLAVDYAYRLLRCHSAELEAHKAFLASLITGNRPEEIPATMEEVQIGSATQYVESDIAGGWFVIEDTSKPNSEFEELPAESELARELLGKKVGDSFILAKSPIQDRMGKIVQILSKYTRRFQAIGDQMQIKFGAQSVIQTMRVPPPDKLTALDVQPVLDSVQARSEAISKLQEIYKSMPVTLHMYGHQFGDTAYEALISLATSEDKFIRCAQPDVAILANTLTMLGSKSTVVLDLTAIATLYLLGIERQIITSTAFRFAVSPSTFAALQQLRVQSQFNKAHGTMYYENGQHYITETTQEQLEKQKARFEEFIQCIERNAVVITVPQLATLAPERRDILERVLGRYGLESAFLALSAGYVWWTDDFVAAEAAKLEFGVERTWSQAILEHIANLGLMDRNTVDEAHAKLVGFNYQSTHFTGSVMIAALRVSNGSVDLFPMRQIVDAFRLLPSTNRTVALRLLAEFILRMSREPMLPESRCLATRSLLHSFPNDPMTNAHMLAFRSQCAALMSLNPVAQTDFIKCFDKWNRERFLIGTVQG
jgi:tetratricopeptide (TPR) repeat protein